MILAFVLDLMDRSRITAALDDVRFVRTVDQTVEPVPTVVIVDLSRYAGVVPEVRAAWPHSTVVGFGPHVDDAAMEAARADGADRVLARSVFFRDITAALGR